jgi:hypothetical protein
VKERQPSETKGDPILRIDPKSSDIVYVDGKVRAVGGMTWGNNMRSLKKALALACGIIVVLAALSLGFNLMNRPSSLALSAGFVVVVFAVWAALKGVRLWITM